MNTPAFHFIPYVHDGTQGLSRAVQVRRAAPVVCAGERWRRGVAADVAHQEAAQAAADGAADPGFRRLTEAEGQAQVCRHVNALAKGSPCGPSAHRQLPWVKNSFTTNVNFTWLGIVGT